MRIIKKYYIYIHNIYIMYIYIYILAADILDQIRHIVQSWVCNLNLCMFVHCLKVFEHPEVPGGTMVKNQLPNVRGMGLIPGLGRFPGEGNGNPVQYSCLGSPMNRGAWRASVHGVTKRVRHDIVTEHTPSVWLCAENWTVVYKGSIVPAFKELAAQRGRSLTHFNRQLYCDW